MEINKAFIFFLIFLCPLFLSGQSNDIAFQFFEVDQVARPIAKPLDQYLKNIHIPNEYDVRGRVILSLVIDSNGHLSKIRVEKSLAPLVDTLILTRLKDIKYWHPAVKDKKRVSSVVFISHYFILR